MNLLNAAASSIASDLDLQKIPAGVREAAHVDVLWALRLSLQDHANGERMAAFEMRRNLLSVASPPDWMGPSTRTLLQKHVARVQEQFAFDAAHIDQAVTEIRAAMAKVQQAGASVHPIQQKRTG